MSYFLPDPGLTQNYTLVTVDAQHPRTQNRLLAGLSGCVALGNVTIATNGVFDGAQAIMPMAQLRAVTFATLWGTKIDGANVRVVRFDGTTWRYLGLVNTTAVTLVAWSLSDTSALIFVTTASTREIWHITCAADGTGYSATAATVDGGASSSAIATLHFPANQWALARFPSTGTLQLGMYHGSGTATTLMLRLANGTGTNWVSTAFTGQKDGDSHFHGLMHHAATGTMVAIRGDGLWHSGDDGATWTRYTLAVAGGTYDAGQCMCDVGMATEAVWGSHDARNHITLFDVTTGLWRHLAMPFRTSNTGADMCCDVNKVGNLILFDNAFQALNGSDYAEHCGLFATTDFTDIVQIHQFPTAPYTGTGAISRATYLGTLGGYLYYVCMSDPSNVVYKLPVPTPTVKAARLVMGAVTNLDVSTQDSVGYWAERTGAGTQQCVTMTAPLTARVGTKAMQFTVSADSMIVFSNGVWGTSTAHAYSITPGKTYNINLSTLFRPADASDATQTYDVWIELYNGSTWDGNYPTWPRCEIPSRRYMPQSNSWMDHRFTFTAPPVTGGVTYSKMRIYIATTSGANTVTMAIYVGAVEVTESTAPHYAGVVAGTTMPSTSDADSTSLTTTGQTVHVMAIQPNWSAGECGDNACALRSWVIDANNHLDLLWVPHTTLGTGTASSIVTTTLNTAANTFTAAMVGAAVVFTTSSKPYTIVTVNTARQVTLAISAAGEVSTDTFSVVSTQGQFQLRTVTAGGAAATQLATPDMYFAKNATINLMVSFSATATGLSVQAAGNAVAVGTGTGGSIAGLANATVAMKLGDSAGANLPAIAILYEDTILTGTTARAVFPIDTTLAGDLSVGMIHIDQGKALGGGGNTVTVANRVLQGGGTYANVVAPAGTLYKAYGATLVNCTRCEAGPLEVLEE